MRYCVSLCVMIGLWSNSAVGQKVFSTEYSHQADINVYVVDYDHQADLCIFSVDYPHQARENRWLWFFTDYAHLADKQIYFVDYPHYYLVQAHGS